MTTNFVSEKILKGTIINYLNKPNRLIVITFFTILGNFLYKLKFQVLPILVIYILLFYNLIFRTGNSFIVEEDGELFCRIRSRYFTRKYEY